MKARSKPQVENFETAPETKSKSDYVKELQAVHECDKHRKACLVILGRDHYHLSNQDLSLWALLLVGQINS